MKAKIVEEDEHERGSRALLNLGHTFGHAVENKINMEGSGILHGEAIGFGMCLSAQFSNKMQKNGRKSIFRTRIQLIATFVIPYTKFYNHLINGIVITVIIILSKISSLI